MFLLLRLSKSKFFHLCRFRAIRVALVSHSRHLCCTRVARVSLMLHSCRIRAIRIALVSLVSGTRVVN